MNEDDEPEPVPLALESLEDYIRRRGLTNNAEVERNGEFNGLTRVEAVRRIDEEKNYFDSVVWKHLDEHVDEDEGKKNDASLSDYQQSDAEEEAVLLVLLSDDVTHTAKVKPLISLCETVRRAVISRSRFGVTESRCDDQNSGESSKQTKGKGHIMELSLVEFNSFAVRQFLDAVASLFHHNLNESNGAKSENKKRRINNDKICNSQTQHVLYLIDNDKISEDHLVECLRIAHYLQCSIMLEVLASVLEASVDSQNCMSLCSLADLYNLQSLFEASVNHVVSRLDSLQGKPNEENDEDIDEGDLSENEKMQQEIWKSLPHELRSRIMTMRNVMRSSVIGRGSKVSGVFFSNGDEFLAIFRETLCDLRERLAESQERRIEVIREREAEWDLRRQRRGRWFDASDEAKRAFVYSGDVEYALSKIQKQEQRIKTLETFYQEQKIIFRSSSFGDSNLVL